MPGFEPIASPIRTSPALLESAEIQPSRPATVADTLTVAESGAMPVWTPERPQLTPPCDYRLIRETERARKLGSSILDTLTMRLGYIKDNIREISAENIKKLKENAEKAHTSGFWSILKKIATCILSTLSIVFGVALIGSGGGALIGGAMIASGILSIANFALSEIGAWDWVAKQLASDNEEWRQRLAMILPAAFGIVAGGIGLVGAIPSVMTGSIQVAEKALYIAQSVVAVFDGVTTLGKGIADARLLWSQGDLTLVQGKMTMGRTQFDSTMREIESSMNDFRAVKSKTKKIIQSISKTNTELVRQALA